MQHMGDNAPEGVTVLFSVEDERKKRNRITKRKSRQRKSQRSSTHPYATGYVDDSLLNTNTLTENCPSCGLLPTTTVEQFQQTNLTPSPTSMSMPEFSPFLFSDPSILPSAQLGFHAPGFADYQNYPPIYDTHSIDDQRLDETFLREDSSEFSRVQSLPDLCTEPSSNGIVDLPLSPPLLQMHTPITYGFQDHLKTRYEPFHQFQT